MRQVKRSIIAAAICGLGAAPAAFADVTLSGNINAGPAVVHSGDGSTNAANSINATGPTATSGVTRSGINTNYSNVTIGSMEDLGGGLKLDFAFQIIAPINSNSSVVNRNSHIGLTSDAWGGVWSIRSIRWTARLASAVTFPSWVRRDTEWCSTRPPAVR
jgi:predicted porin